MSDTKSGTRASESWPLDEAGVSHSAPNSAGATSLDSPEQGHATDSSEHEAHGYPDFDERQDTVISKRPPAPDADAPRPFSPNEMGAALQGQQLGHFELEEFVGGGGMGAVFRARDTSLDRTVAVKVLSRDHADPDIHRRFRNEAQSAARLDHDNISRVFYVGQDKGWNYIVFEFVDGLNIRDIVVAKGPLPLAEAISYTLQVAEALEHASRRDVVHRDIKPSNVLITSSGHVKLVDMGLARLHQVETPESDLTASGVTLGTFDYISPEQARDPRIADVRSDLYSLGCTFYFMLTGRAPFPEGTVLQKLLSHTSDERPDPRLYRPDLPEEVAEILSKLLARRPESRYQQANELIGELLLVSEHLGIPNTGHRGRIWVTRSAKQPSWLERLTPVILPLLLLLLAVWGLEKFFGRADETPVVGRQRFLRSGTTDEQKSRGTKSRSESTNVVPRVEQDSSKAKSSPNPDAEEKRVPTEESSPKDAQQVPDQSSIVRGTPVADAGQPKKIGAIATPAPLAEDTAAEISLPFSEGSLSEQVAVDARLDGSDVLAVLDEKRETVPPAAVRQLVVTGQEPLDLPSDAVFCGSLGQAVQTLENYPNVEAIELRFDGRVREMPFQITASDLTIQAGEGYEPIITFEPGATELALGGQMIRQDGGNVTWSGIQLEMTLPEDASSGGWSLFELHKISSLNLRQSSMTIRNAHKDGSSRHPNVAFFRVSVPPSLKMMAMPGESAPMQMTPVIELRHCIARGEATLIRMPEVTPIRLSWNQGLFATNERLIEAQGAAKITDRDRPIEIDLMHLTASMPQGMCQLVGETDSQDQLHLDIECTACIFLGHCDVPFIEHTGVRDASEVKSSWLEFRGNNFFPTFEGTSRIVCWRIAPLGDPENELTLTSADREEQWWDGTIQPVVLWQNSPTSESIAHRQLPRDYVLLNELRNPPIQFANEHGNAGFDIDNLPKLLSDPSIDQDVDSPNSVEAAREE